MKPSNYSDFLATKRMTHHATGITVNVSDINPILFPFQRDLVRWACRKGRCAIFADTGLGKTPMQIEWARLMGGRSLIVAPLSVARQTVRIAMDLLGIPVRYCRTQSDISDGINITNYEMIEHFDPSEFTSVVLDESSILKAIDGKTRKKLTGMFQGVPYRLCCTATPAPNDHIELGNHAEFLGICTEAEMKAMFFINANKETTLFVNGTAHRKKGSNKGGVEWRLKHPAEKAFFRWLASWAISIIKPSDLGYDDTGFILPELKIIPEIVHTYHVPDGQLFFTKLHGISDRCDVRRHTLPERLKRLKVLVDEIPGQWIVWAGLDVESRTAKDSFPESVEVKGSDSPESKAAAFEDFQDGKFRILITKAKIGGFGMNFQNAHNMAFLGINDSWESWYQCIRREWRYGQGDPVNVHVVISDVEHEIYRNIQRKDAMAKRLRHGLIAQTREYETEELRMSEIEEEPPPIQKRTGHQWEAYNGDSCEILPLLPGESIDLSVYSPPFADLFTYTDSPRDLGNSRNWPEFFEHYAFIIREILRITKRGRMTCVHTSDIPAMAQRDGYIGIRDFPGAVIRAYEIGGWTFVGRAFVQKNPQAQAIRTKSKALLFVQIRKDSTDSRPALIDQILLFRRPGDNVIPVNPVANGELDNETWIEWAHGIWLGIRETETLQFSRGRGEDDEKHICPLQLGVIERCVKLYSNPGETVLSPFMGIGSEGFISLKLNRRFIGIELKDSYFNAAINNLIAASDHDQQSLFKVAQ